MGLLITYITIWVVSPGAVCVKTIQETRQHGSRAGILISSGASMTAILMGAYAGFKCFNATLNDPNTNGDHTMTKTGLVQGMGVNILF